MIVWLVGDFPAIDVEGIEFVGVNSLPVLSSNDREPETVIFRQDHPGTWSRETIETWRKQFPLARLCVAYGNWSEGEMRTGQPLPGVERIRLMELPAWLETLADQSRLPATASIAEQIEAASIPSQIAEHLAGIRTAIVASVYETREALTSLVGSLGLALPPDGESIELVLWSDGDLQLQQGQASLAKTRDQFPSAAIVAVVHFPRPHEVELAKSQGVAEVVALPLLARNLAGAIVRALDNSR